MSRTHASLLAFFLALPTTHCGGTPDDAQSPSLESDPYQSASSINGGETGAFDRAFSPRGYTAISSTVTVPDYDAATDGSQGEPYVYYIITDDFGGAAMEAGLCFQHGDASKPHRWRPYVRAAGGAMEFASETYTVAVGQSVDMAATFDGSTVRLKIGGAIAKTGHLALSTGSAHVARVVGNALSTSYTGGDLATVGPVVFSNTVAYDAHGGSKSFESVKGWSTKQGGKIYGTVLFPSAKIEDSVSGSDDTITLFPGSGSSTSGSGTTMGSTGTGGAGGSGGSGSSTACDNTQESAPAP